MGGSLQIPAGAVYGLVALALIPLWFVCTLVIRLVAGPRERILWRGFRAFALSLVSLGLATWASRLVGPLVAAPLGLALVVTAFKFTADTAWWRALLGVLLSGAISGILIRIFLG